LILNDVNWTNNLGVATLNTPIDTITVAEMSDTVTIQFTVDAGFQDTLITNVAEVSHAASTVGGPNADDIDSTPDGLNGDVIGADNVTDNSSGDEDDHDPASIIIDQTFDLALIKTLASSTTNPIEPGTNVTFNITIYNQGTVDAYDININDYIPTGLILDDVNWTAAGGIATLNNEIDFLAANDDIIRTITFQVDPTFQGNTITNNAEIRFRNGILRT